MDYYENNPELKKAIDQIKEGFFCSSEPEAFHDVVNSLLHHDRWAIGFLKGKWMFSKNASLAFSDPKILPL